MGGCFTETVFHECLKSYSDWKQDIFFPQIYLFNSQQKNSAQIIQSISSENVRHIDNHHTFTCVHIHIYNIDTYIQQKYIFVNKMYLCFQYVLLR